MPKCERCAEPLPWQRRSDARFCSGACRVAAHRARRETVPVELRALPRWTRRDGKRPVTVSGTPASSTNPNTWASYDTAVHSAAGGGAGIMLGDGLGCYDLDHVTDEQARKFAASVPERIVYAERSMSGEGVHLFVEAPEGPGWKRSVGGVSVERYSRARFIAVTGDRWEV